METIRQQMIVLLTEREMSARELSQAIGIREKEVYEHLPHIARSVAVQKQKLIIQPAQCLGCGYQVAALTANSHTLMSQDI
jgi:predicted Zn-ribbon and HTH transcriptional regulator